MKNNDKSSKNSAQIVIITEDNSGQRLDNFLFNNIKNIPKSRVYKMIRGGEVRVNKKRAKPLYKLQLDDQVRIPPYWEESSGSVKKPPINLAKKLLGQIIFEDENILVLSKPAGVVVHAGSGVDFGVIELLRVARSDLENLELVHRLDRDTSGCLILAKNKKSLRKLHQLIKEGKLVKKYTLLVRGKWQGGEEIVDLSLSKNSLQSGERMVVVDSGGKESITIFRPLEVAKEYSLLEAELKTGRTHQIRVHAASIGYPIVGDHKYGDKDFNKKMKELGFDRMFLHASSISFVWDNGRQVELSVPLDIDLKAL